MLRPARRLPFAALLLGSVTLLAACGGDDDSATTTTSEATTTTAPPPSTTEPPGEPIDPAVLQVGDCFEERVIPGQGQTEFDEEQTVIVDCDDPHLNEVYLVTEMPQEAGAPFPGADAVDEFAEEVCLDAFEDFVGLDYVESRFEIGKAMPSEETWPLPDRTVTCFVFDRDGGKTSGTARGSAE